MEVLKNIAEKFMKYTEILIHKSEKAAKKARLKMQIRCKISEIKKIHCQIGNHVVDTMDADSGTQFLKDEILSSKYDVIKSIRDEIELLRDKLNSEDDTYLKNSGE